MGHGGSSRLSIGMVSDALLGNGRYLAPWLRSQLALLLGCCFECDLDDLDSAVALYVILKS